MRHEWWALSDRGPGGGLIDYAVRVQRLDINVHPITGRILHVKVKETVTLEDPKGLLDPPSAVVGAPVALNGLNPLLLNGNAAALGRSFDPEGLVIDPRTGHLIIADEYGPSIYEFTRGGRLIGIFETPEVLLPRPLGTLDYVAGRDGGDVGLGTPGQSRLRGPGHQPRRLAPLRRAPGSAARRRSPQPTPPTTTAATDGTSASSCSTTGGGAAPTARASRSTSIRSKRRRRSAPASSPPAAPPPAPIRGRGATSGCRRSSRSTITSSSCSSATTAASASTTRPAADPSRGAIPALGVVGSKRVYKIDIDGATDVSELVLPDDGNLAAVGIVPVQKNDADVFIDLAATTLLPNGNQAEKWEGLAIGPRLLGGGRVILAGNDNDYSVTQTGAGEQFDVYVNFAGSFARCVLDDPTRCIVDPPAADTPISTPVTRAQGLCPPAGGAARLPRVEGGPRRLRAAARALLDLPDVVADRRILRVSCRGMPAASGRRPSAACTSSSSAAEKSGSGSVGHWRRATT